MRKCFASFLPPRPWLAGWLAGWLAPFLCFSAYSNQLRRGSATVTCEYYYAYSSSSSSSSSNYYDDYYRCCCHYLKTVNCDLLPEDPDCLCTDNYMRVE